jgi:hypothetical protein
MELTQPSEAKGKAEEWEDKLALEVEALEAEVSDLQPEYVVLATVLADGYMIVLSE